MEVVNVTLRMRRANDYSRPATWRILHASQLPAVQQGWLVLPAVQGLTDALAIGEGNTDIPITLVLRSSGIRERVAPYTQTLQIDVRSDQPGYSADAARTEEVRISVSVQARTSFVVWGQQTFLCDRAATGREQHDISATLGVRLVVPFTTCDDEGLPVDHPQPSQLDPRNLDANLVASTGALEPVPIEYSGSGVYLLLLTVLPPRPFPFSHPAPATRPLRACLRPELPEGTQ